MGGKCIPGVNDAATTDPERSKMFVDFDVARTLTRGSNKRVLFRCLSDVRHPNWESRVLDAIARGRDCPTCNGLQVIAGINDVATTDPERSKMFVNQELARTVTRSSSKKAWFRCLSDARHPDWEARIGGVISGRGCAACSGLRCVVGVNDAATTDPERSKMFANPEVAKTVTRSSGKKAWFYCADDARHPNWEARVANVIAVGQGCPTCRGLRCVTGINDVTTTDPERARMFADPKVANAVTRSSSKMALFRCTDDAGHPTWEAHIMSTIAGGHGCAACSTPGFDPSKPGTLYILDATTHIVFGITGNLEQRLKSYDDSRVLLHCFDFDDGGEARRIESAIKRQFRNCRYAESNLPGEKFESLTLDCLADLLAFIAESSKLNQSPR